jgi:hypothetical protein
LSKLLLLLLLLLEALAQPGYMNLNHQPLGAGAWQGNAAAVTAPAGGSA